MTVAKALKHTWFACIWASIAVWIYATRAGWVKSEEFISHVSMFAVVLQFAIMWLESRAERQQEKRDED